MAQAHGYHAGSGETDQPMLSESKSLQWLDIGTQLLHAPFSGVVYGSLTSETEPTFHTAKEAHLYGVVSEGVGQLQSALSLKMNVVTPNPNHLDGLFPQLQHLDLRIISVSDLALALSSALRYASIELLDGSGMHIMLQVTGATPKGLKYLHLEGPQVRIPATLYVWAGKNGVSPKTQSQDPDNQFYDLCATQVLPTPTTVLHIST